MATGSQGSGAGSVLRVILGSAVIAVLISTAMMRLGSSDAAREARVSAPQAAEEGTPKGTTSRSVAQQSQGLSQATAGTIDKAAVKQAQAQPVEAAGANVVTGATPKVPSRYLDAVWNELHFKPGIDKATNEECLTCHQEILKAKVREQAPAGVKANDALAWYQTLDTYEGEQVSFHARHMTTPFAKKVMNLKCNFCHQGADPREEAGSSSATTTPVALGDFTLRKQVNPSKSCLLCHGKFPIENMGLEGTWADQREALETPEQPNGCLSCHAEQFRTVRHQVSYLNASAIEDVAKSGSSDGCYGCHGGRQWYRNSYPYPRHPWPGMDKEVPEWAKGRPTESAPEHRLNSK